MHLASREEPVPKAHGEGSCRINLSTTLQLSSASFPRLMAPAGSFYKSGALHLSGATFSKPARQLLTCPPFNPLTREQKTDPNKARQLTALAQPRHSCEHTGCPQHGARPSLAFLQRDDSSSKKSQEWDPHNAKQTAPLPVLAAKSRLGGSLALSPAGGSGGCGGGGEAGGGTHPSQVGGKAGAACGAACQGERRDP